MRLLNVESFKLESYDNGNVIPPYVILSHKWAEDEILFQDLQEVPRDLEILELRQSLRDMEQRFERLERLLNAEKDTAAQIQGGNPQQENIGALAGRVDQQGDDIADQVWSLPHLNRARQKEGWKKIHHCCKEASALGFSHVWIDTCCINKDSSSELSEAINSMFSWYRNATVCIAYLSDVSSENNIEEFRSSKWFTRGWTLQELIAPNDVWFYSQDWQFLGLRSALAATITSITSISGAVLCEKSQKCISDFTVAARLSWASMRGCTRAEDRSYSLLGLFGINMPSIYGEGERSAFFRLQFEIFKVNPDHSIFAWEHHLWHRESMFAPRVECFRQMSSIVSNDKILHGFQPRAEPALKYSKVSHGIRVWLLIRPYEEHFQACLYCKHRGSYRAIGILLTEVGEGHFIRRTGGIQEIEADALRDEKWFMKEAFISHQRNDLKRNNFSLVGYSNEEIHIYDEQVLRYGFERVKFPLNFPTDASVSGISLTSASDSFLRGLADFHDLSSKSMLLRWEETRERINACVYLNRDTMAIFAITIEWMEPRILSGVSVGIIEPSNFRHLRRRLTTGTTSKTLTSGWHVFIRGFEPPGWISCLNLSVKPVTSLEAGVQSG